jgi:RNA polymerase sigma-70 factor, ECF subfamily
VQGQSTSQSDGAPSSPTGGTLLPDVTGPLKFDAVYHAYFRQVVGWIRAMGAPESDMEDIAQDVFMTVRRKLPSFGEGNLAGWLYRIAEYTVRNYRRLAWFKNLFSRGQSLDTIEPAAVGSTPAMSLEQKQDQQAISRILARMSEKRRETLVLFEVEGYSGQEIAILQGVPVKTVWTRLHHARKDLVAMVADLRKQRELEAGSP